MRLLDLSGAWRDEAIGIAKATVDMATADAGRLVDALVPVLYERTYEKAWQHGRKDGYATALEDLIGDCQQRLEDGP